jgi:Asp/Glu/hydantoin racemase
MKVAMLHTVPTLAGPLADLAAELSPGTQIIHYVDESLLQDTIAHDGPPPHVQRRLVSYAVFARESGADALLVTCSSIGEAAEQARPLADLPILRIDEPMAEEAVRTGQRIGVLATLATTLGPTTRAVQRAAVQRATAQHAAVQGAAGRLEADREVHAHLCEGAFAALRSGDSARHDALVRQGFQEVAGKVDVVVLAQASMARILGDIATDLPVLSSPRSGVAQITHLEKRAVAAPEAAGRSL